MPFNRHVHRSHCSDADEDYGVHLAVQPTIVLVEKGYISITTSCVIMMYFLVANTVPHRILFLL